MTEPTPAPPHSLPSTALPAIPMDTLRIPASQAHLEEVREFVISRTPPMLEHKVDLVLEELFLNVANYAYGDTPGEVEVSCGVDETASPPRFHLCVSDWGAAFDPLALPDPNIAASLDEREPGGLGVHLVKKMTNALDYAREDGANRLHCCFFFGA